MEVVYASKSYPQRLVCTIRIKVVQKYPNLCKYRKRREGSLQMATLVADRGRSIRNVGYLETRQPGIISLIFGYQGGITIPNTQNQLDGCLGHTCPIGGAI